DVYAIGAMLYHLIAGRPPHGDLDSPPHEVIARVRDSSPTPLAQVADDAPHDLVAIVPKSMAPDPAQRCAHAKPTPDEPRRLLAGERVSAHEYSLRELLVRWIGRHRAAVSVFVAAFAVISVLSAIGVFNIILERDEAAAQRHLALEALDREKAERNKLILVQA